MAEELHVSIATEQLRETARDIAVKVSALKAVFEDMDMAVKRTEGYWIGRSGKQFSPIFSDRRTIWPPLRGSGKERKKR